MKKLVIPEMGIAIADSTGKSKITTGNQLHKHIHHGLGMMASKLVDPARKADLRSERVPEIHGQAYQVALHVRATLQGELRLPLLCY